MNTRNFIRSFGRGILSDEMMYRLKSRVLFLENTSIIDNIYHCCTHRSASQWIRDILGDRIVFKYTGLRPFHYQTEWMDKYDPRPYDERYFSKSFPQNTIVSPIYIDYDCFLDVGKPEHYRAFFVLRDPRDIVVSWYFSTKYSHQLMGPIQKHRHKLKNINKRNGIIYGIDRLKDIGLFGAQRSWITSKNDERVRVYKYENLVTGDNLKQIKDLFCHCQIDVPDNIIVRLIEKNSFSEKTKGRKRGKEDKGSHNRKGVPGDWRNHFDNEILDYFFNKTGNLIDVLGYDMT